MTIPDRAAGAAAPSTPTPGLRGVPQTVRTAHTRQALEATGHVWTRQRQIVVEILRATHTPLDLDQIRALAQRRSPRLSRATVYRTLQLMRQHGLLREWQPDTSGEPSYSYAASALYMPDRAQLVCRTCGKAVGVESPHLPRLLKDLQERYGYHFGGATMDLSARCDWCVYRRVPAPVPGR